jgi:drug/metabolite transporter (DMT)-like permease
MYRLTARQIVLVVVLTLVWGINWPIMKMGVTDYPPFTFRALSMVLGVPVLAGVLVVLKVPFRVPRKYWPELLRLAVTNMFVWHICILFAVKTLSSGRSAILGYTMPIFSAVIGAMVFGAGLPRRAWLGVGAAALGVILLLWHELTGLAGRPAGVMLALIAAATWALGTQLLRRTRIPLPTLTLGFWMTTLTMLLMCGLSWQFERDAWAWPNPVTDFAIVFNAVAIFGFAQPTWFVLARALPPIASTLSVMMIPVLGVFSGAWWLGEVLHWQDWAAIALMVAAIASVLWPPRAPVVASGGGLRR